MVNKYWHYVNAQLSVWAANYAAVVLANLSGYHTSSPKATAVSDAQEVFATSLIDVDNAKAAYQAALEARDAARQTLLDNISLVNSDIYNGNTLPSLIAAAGLEPRATTRATLSPQMPLNLLATPDAMGGVVLAWKRNGNPGSATFVVETSNDNENWTLVSTTSKTRFSTFGFTPGHTAYFRVYAQKNGLTSQPSATAAIYLPAPSAEVQIAA